MCTSPSDCARRNGSPQVPYIYLLYIKKTIQQGKTKLMWLKRIVKKVLGAPKPYRFFQYPFLDNITHPWTHPSLVFFEHDPQKSNLLLIHHGWSPFSLLETIWFHGTFGYTIIIFPFSLLETMISCDFGIQHCPPKIRPLVTVNPRLPQQLQAGELAQHPGHRYQWWWRGAPGGVWWAVWARVSPKMSYAVHQNSQNFEEISGKRLQNYGLIVIDSDR